ncbi:MAG: hypothetical protein RBR63_03245 [Methanosarcina vacuolata]|jgi:hypothetical protein|nr:hypothetical protein [Methanosarcina vacuolata]
MHTENNNIHDYLKNDVIDYDHKLIVYKCLESKEGTDDKISLITAKLQLN